MLDKLTCANCYHDKENHKGTICSGTLTCLCETYIESELFEFAQLIEKEKITRKGIFDRVKFVLEKIPNSQNAGEKSFYKIYVWVWHDFKIKKGTELDSKTWRNLPNQDTVNREKRRVKQKYPSLATNNPNVQYYQSAIFAAYQELAIES